MEQRVATGTPAETGPSRYGEIVIRDSTPADRAFVLEAVHRLSSFGAPTGRTREEIVEGEARTLRAFFDRGDDAATLLIADAAGRASGFVYLEDVRDYFTNEQHGHIGILVVKGEAEGRGVGAALIRASEQWARGRGYRTLTLNVFDGNHRARGVYEHLGFKPDTIKYKKPL